MSTLRELLNGFVPERLGDWAGLPAGTAPADLDGPRGEGRLGDERVAASWVSVPSDVFAGGLRVWHDGSTVLAVEGLDPLGADGGFLDAPELGEPEAALDTYLGRLQLHGGERVYASRGLAVRVNPENGVLLGTVGFPPTTVDEYRARLRPEVAPQRLLPHPPEGSFS